MKDVLVKPILLAVLELLSVGECVYIPERPSKEMKHLYPYSLISSFLGPALTGTGGAATTLGVA